MQVDPEFLRELDPRKSYLPVTRPPEDEETGGVSRVAHHFLPVLSHR